MPSPTIKDIATLLGCKEDAARSRLIALGYVEPCSRCGGSGRYSYNQMDGDKCFKCRGGCRQIPRLTKKIMEDAKARQDAGELAPYFAANAARKAARKAIEPAYAILKEVVFKGPIYIRYDHKGLDICAHTFVESDYFRAVNLIGSCDKVAFQAKLNWEYHNADPEVTLAIIREATEFARLINAAAEPHLDGWFAQMVIDSPIFEAQKKAREEAEWNAYHAAKK